ncbi:MAG TPA: RNA polymerase factor sigma-54 [Terriglobales bacterium]|nr:RNA polymerase factor sigma-54 [Terriglobales bacterium]
MQLQTKLNLKVTQKQILTPGLVQMVSVLALNKLELKDMINAEMVENPVLEELESPVPSIDDVSRSEEKNDRASVAAEEANGQERQRDPFEEIDFGSYFRDYLDPGYRSPAAEITERPSFENFLSSPTTLTDHLMWQLRSLHLRDQVRAAAELIIGNLNEDGYLTATDEELLAAARGQRMAEPADVAPAEEESPEPEVGPEDEPAEAVASEEPAESGAALPEVQPEVATAADEGAEGEGAEDEGSNVISMPSPAAAEPEFDAEALREAHAVVRQLDPVGVGARDLRECLLAQLEYQQQLRQQLELEVEEDLDQVLTDCIAVVSDHLKALEGRQQKEIARAIGRPAEAVERAVSYLRTLDPRPGLRYNRSEPRLIEPEVAFVKQGEEYLIVMNDEDVPQLRLNPAYRRLLNRDGADREVRTYVKERYRSAVQLIKNIEQRRQTIQRVCQVILDRQRDFLDQGMDHLKPMMIKEVAEEIGVHPSTVSRAVANKYVHTPQGVLELRYFFSEGVQGPEGSTTSLLVLKQRVKKLIEEEDPTRPLTDEQITRILQSQGIQVTRRTVAKYREDMRIPSTHQRRVKK